MVVLQQTVNLFPLGKQWWFESIFTHQFLSTIGNKMKESNKQRSEKLNKKEIPKLFVDRLIEEVPWTNPGVFVPLFMFIVVMSLFCI